MEISNFQRYSIDLDATEIEHKSPRQLAGLHKLALEGNERAWQDLWLHGTKLVLKIVNKLSDLDLLRCSYEDAVAEGNLAIGEALSRWNPKKAQFSTWVWIQVRGAVQDLSKREHNEGMIGTTLEDGPTVLGETFEVSRGREPMVNSRFDLVPETWGRDPAWIAEEDELREKLSDLPDREFQYLVMHYFEDLSLQDIADLEGISKVRVHQIVKRAEDILRERT